ncbi:hypothetical protein, partial [Providencia rettgeri]|uniref:hypothetical protein n=2 Tax=Providencia TaxID=586 RepID=UPI001B381933
MNEELIERIVQRVLRQLKRHVLVVLSPVDGYQQAIYQRLVQLESVAFSFYATASMLQSSQVEKWAELGSVVNKNTLSINGLSHYDSLFLPFIDAKVVGEIANGLFASEESELALQALSQNMSTLALKYHCCPESELSQVLGLNKNENYNQLIRENISKVIKLGVYFDSFNEIENKLLTKGIDENLKPEINNGNQNRY